MILMKLKQKYLQPGRVLHRMWDPQPEGTPVYIAGKHPARSRANSPRPSRNTIRPRMKAYWGNVSRP